MSQVIHVGDDGFDAEVLQANSPVLVDFYADWCMPCRMIAADVERLAGAMQGRARVVKVNVDEAPGIASRYHITSIPTLLVFTKGEVVSTLIGLRPYAELEQVLTAATRAAKPA